MAVETPVLTDAERRQLKMFFEQTRSLPQLLATLRSRRVAMGYAIESGEPETRASGRTLVQEKGPLAFKSEHAVVPLSELEEALVAWSACGPNGMAHWDIAIHGGFHELVTIAGRTAAAPGNSFAHDLLVIRDDGAYIYNPGSERSKMVEIESEQDYDKILDWYRRGLTRVHDGRPDVDWNLFDAWHIYFVDDATQQPAGVDRWVGEGKLEFPIAISQIEQFLFQVETYPPGSYVQNMRLAAEAMGLGNWIFCGYFDDVLMGAFPDLARGLGFRTEPLNAKAPAASGALKVFGVEGVKEATYVPSPRYRDGRAVMQAMMDEKYGKGATMSQGDDNWMLTHGGPFKPDVVREIVQHPVTRVSDWAVEACIAYVDYCVERYGQCPVYFNPMQCQFGAVVHHVDTAFYEKYYVGGSITPQIREHMRLWH